mgnify:CR=1 FL=1
MQKLGLSTYQAEYMEINHALGLNLKDGQEKGGSICQSPSSKTELTHASSVEGF